MNILWLQRGKIRRIKMNLYFKAYYDSKIKWKWIRKLINDESVWNENDRNETVSTLFIINTDW